MATVSKKSNFQTLLKIRRGTYKKGSQGHTALMYFREKEPYKLTTHPKIISYNYVKDIFTVK